MTKKEISLFNMVGVGLIIKDTSSVFYTNQTGGVACFQSSEEGYFVPINNDCSVDDFKSTLEFRLATLFEEKENLSEHDADKLDELLSSFGESKFISCDREKLHKSVEAWVFVKIDYEKCDSLRGFTSSFGVLTWPNSD